MYILFVPCFEQLWRISETNFQLRVFNNQFVGLKNNGNGIDVVAESNTPGSSETFAIVRNSNDLNRVRIKAPNGLFLQVISISLVFIVVNIFPSHFMQTK